MQFLKKNNKNIIIILDSERCEECSGFTVFFCF